MERIQLAHIHELSSALILAFKQWMIKQVCCMVIAPDGFSVSWEDDAKSLQSSIHLKPEVCICAGSKTQDSACSKALWTQAFGVLENVTLGGWIRVFYAHGLMSIRSSSNHVHHLRCVGKAAHDATQTPTQRACPVLNSKLRCSR